MLPNAAAHLGQGCHKDLIHFSFNKDLFSPYVLSIVLAAGVFSGKRKSLCFHGTDILDEVGVYNKQINMSNTVQWKKTK